MLTKVKPEDCPDCRNGVGQCFECGQRVCVQHIHQVVMVPLPSSTEQKSSIVFMCDWCCPKGGDDE